MKGWFFEPKFDGVKSNRLHKRRKCATEFEAWAESVVNLFICVRKSSRI